MAGVKCATANVRPSFNWSAYDVRRPVVQLRLASALELGGGISRCPSRAPRAFGLTEATPTGRSSRERMARKMRAMEWESFMILLTPARSIEELNDDWVAHIKILDFPFISIL